MKNTIPLKQLDGCINTKSGGKLNLLDPQPSQINIEDIARGLAYNSHFGGQTPYFFSIAQHCLLVCDLIEECYHAKQTPHPQLLMAALLHDASEAYLGDMVKPLKVHLPEFQKIENKMKEVIFEKWKLPINWILDFIKRFDHLAQDLEYNDFYNGTRLVTPFSPQEAYILFRDRFIKYSLKWDEEKEEWKK